MFHPAQPCRQPRLATSNFGELFSEGVEPARGAPPSVPLARERRSALRLALAHVTRAAPASPQPRSIMAT
ncbi:MAG: hypothetical protein JWN93_1896 [Hyphomicrobiales bacterium]|nr:hypothetical protein [Hyphomicrobiales bacterium]